jgi:hypothetical protein
MKSLQKQKQNSPFPDVLLADVVKSKSRVMLKKNSEFLKMKMGP